MNGRVATSAERRKQSIASCFEYAFCPPNDLRAFDELHVDRHLDLHDVDAVAVLGELGHAAGDDLRLLLRELEALLVGALFIADELEEERDVVGAALVADALDPRVLLVVDRPSDRTACSRAGS